MTNKLNQVVDSLLDGMHQMSSIETVVGEPLQAGDALLVPIHRLRVGFGVGALGAGGHSPGSEGNYGGRAVGGGVQLEPIAVVAIAKDGRPRLMAVDGEPEQMMGQLFDQVPSLLGRIMGLVTRRRESEQRAIGLESDAAAAHLPESKAVSNDTVDDD